MTAVTVAALVVTGCAAGTAGGGSDAGPAVAGQDTAGAAPSGSASLAAGFADAPAVIGIQYGRTGDALSGPELPLVYRGDPGEDGELRSGGDGQLLGVAPTGDLAAFLEPATAVAPASVRVESIATGTEVDRVELTGQSFSQLFWSPDGRGFAYSDDRGFYVHRIGGSTSALAPDAGGRPTFSSNSTATSVAFCSDANGRDSVLTAQAGATDGRTEDPGLCDSVAQGISPTGNPVGMFVLAASTADPRTQVLIASTEGPSVPVDLSGLPAGQSLRLLTDLGFAEPPCGGTIIRFERGGIYDIENGTLTPTPASESCPVPSPDHSRYAVATSAGPVVVVAAGMNTPIQVADAGFPIAWAADGSELAVEGNGTFLVNPDGSGGRPASVQVGNDAAPAQSAARFCRAGDTGKAIIVTDEGPALFDVGSDRSVALPAAANGDTCWLTIDSRWLVTGSLMVDIENEVGLALVAPGEQSDLSAYSDHRWVGPQLAFTGGRPLR